MHASHDSAGLRQLPPATPPVTLQGAILAGITLAIFFPTLWSGFVYDARMQILTDPFLHDSSHWLPVLTLQVLGLDVLDGNRPVQLASLMLDAAGWGRQPFGYHLTSVLIHTVNTLLVWLLIRRAGTLQHSGASAATPPPGPLAPGWPDTTAWLGGLFFAVHPLVTEAVCEPCFREDLLVALFTLGALVLALGHVPAGVAGSLDPRRAGACAACCFLSVASKESGVGAPLALGLVGLLAGRNWRADRFWPAAVGGGLLLVACFLAARFWLAPESVIFTFKPTYLGGSLAAALEIQPRILALYAQLVVWPANLSADYGAYSIAHLPAPVALSILLPLVAGVGWAAWHDRRMTLAIGLVLLPLLPVCNLVPIYRAAADRYLYLPLAGVALAMACLLAAPAIAQQTRTRKAACVTATLLLCLLAASCVWRQRVWSNPQALWEDTAQKNPASPTAQGGLAESLWEAGRLPEAEQAARNAISLTAGTAADHWLCLALILADSGQASAAQEMLLKALAIDPRLANPDQRVACLAMDHKTATALRALLAARTTGR